MEEIPVTESPLQTCLEHVNRALSTLKHHQFFIVVFSGADGKVTFSSSKSSLNGFVEGLDDFDANVLYLECITKAPFHIQQFSCAPNTSYHLVYKR